MEALSDADADAVLRLHEAITAAAGFSRLSDPVVAAVRRRAAGLHLLHHRGGVLVGYAHIDDSDEHPVAELIVEAGTDPTGLLSVVADTAAAGLQIWARGDDDPLAELLPDHGFALVRTLLQLRRPLDEPIDEPTWPVGVTVRSFEVGADEETWLTVNNAAFAGHPEQSGWTRQDIDNREAEPWFDPAGFFLAEAEGRLAGFHWTKQHNAELGEVYVIGVAPEMQGKGVAKPLLLEGLRHLRDGGMTTVLLYVEADNEPALKLYSRLGFTTWSTDRLFQAP